MILPDKIATAKDKIISKKSTKKEIITTVFDEIILFCCLILTPTTHLVYQSEVTRKSSKSASNMVYLENEDQQLHYILPGW